MSRRMWETVETRAGKIRVGKIKMRRNKKKKNRKGKNNRSKEGSKRMEDLEWKREGCKIGRKSEKVIPERFHKWIYIFGKKASKRIPTRKLWDHTIDIKKIFVLKKKKIYPLLREEREEVCELILE